mmetsp:Transcript_82469/g.237075  ORF Transcript_82469/g.237075 Transcript_82469/m.237075 type:complete len:235 (-) Transcript_82469:674-1378(-)
MQLGRLVLAQRARHQLEWRMLRARALRVKCTIAFQAQVVLALQAEAQSDRAAVDTLKLAIREQRQVEPGVFFDPADPMVLHLGILLHIALQGLCAIDHIGHVDVLVLAIASSEDLQLGLQVSNDAPTYLDVVAEDVSQTSQVLWAYQRVLASIRLHPRGLVSPEESVHSNLHDLFVSALHVRLLAEVPKLPEVVVEGVFPRHPAIVRVDVAHDATDALVTRPRLGKLRLREGLH